MRSLAGAYISPVVDTSTGLDGLTSLSGFSRRFERVRIGADSWIGNAAVVMANVGAHCVVGAGSIVVSDVPDWCVVAGNPARMLRRLSSECTLPGAP